MSSCDCFDLPGVDNVLLSASLEIGVENQVTVSSIELPIVRRVHRNFIPTLDPPHLPRSRAMDFYNCSVVVYNKINSNLEF